MNAASWTSTVALVWATVFFTLFTIVYSRRGPWWKPDRDDPHAEVRANLGYFMAALALICWVYDFRPLFEPGVFAWVRAALFWVIGLLGAWRFSLLIRSGKPHRRVH